MNNPIIIGFIPARYASARLPGKALADIAGLPMVVRTLQGASQAKTLSRCIVLTDDRRIFDAVTEHSGEALMTPVSCRNGTERIAYALDQIPCDIAVNIQGDEPEITGEYVDNAVAPLLDDDSLDISTLVCPVKDEDELYDVSANKVVLDLNGFALYFSRSTIPYPCHTDFSGGGYEKWWKHIGLYVYKSEVVKALMQTEPTFLETAEKLEQLRMLEMGYRIKVVKVNEALIGVDTSEDLEAIRRRFKN